MEWHVRQLKWTMRDGWQKLTPDWDRHKTHVKHIRCPNPAGPKPDLQQRNIKTFKVSSRKWNWFAENHIQTALSKLSVKKLERIWEGWGTKREHVEAITGSRRDLLAFGLLGASTLLIHQPSLFPQSTNPSILLPQLTTKPSGASYNAAFSMHLWLGEEKKSVNLLRPKGKSHMEL